VAETNTQTLEKMGIEKPEEIVRYTLRQKSPRQDVLKIFYERTKGSLRPVSRTYQFGRAPQTVVADSGEPRMDETYEISPILLAAVGELDALLQVKEAGGSEKHDLLAEISSLKELLGADGALDPIEAANRLDRLRDRVQRL